MELKRLRPLIVLVHIDQVSMFHRSFSSLGGVGALAIQHAALAGRV